MGTDEFLPMAKKRLTARNKQAIKNYFSIYI